MTTWIIKKLHAQTLISNRQNFMLSKDMLLLISFLSGLLLLSQTQHALFELIVSTLSDAYLGVSIFVAITLGGFYLLERCFKADITQFLNRHPLMQVPCAAFLGALPGCGGAIIVVTQFVHGKMSFGALVAVLIATMGDAAFILIAKKPDVALLVYGISLSAGILFGYFIHLLHGPSHLKPESTEKRETPPEVSRIPKRLAYIFLLLLLPGSVVGILDAFQFDANPLFGPLASYEPVTWLGFVGALVCIAVWISQPLNSWSARFAEKPKSKEIREAVVAETGFISVWVILGFLCYELLVFFTDLDLAAQFLHLGAMAPLLAILIGFVPGCGPQIVITTLYVNGVVPLSSQLANAISNDGDALFPAIALAPKAAVKATIYSAIPAFIVGYSAYFMRW